jgi:hypothetical protein
VTRREPLTRWLLLGTTAAIIVAAMVEAWFPFDVELPVDRRHGPAVGPAGSVVFDGSAALVSAASPPWLATLTAADRLQVRLTARTASTDQEGPARILSVARDPYSMDLLVGQEHDDLLVRLRRPGADDAGQPPIVVPDVFATRSWRDIALDVDRAGVRIAVDGTVVAEEPYPPASQRGAGPFAGWDGDQRSSVGDAPGGDRAWRGELSRAEVHGQDLLRLPAADDLVVDSRLDRLWMLRPRDPAAVNVGRLAAFAVLGALVGLVRPARPVLVAAVALPLVLTAGKVFVAGRDPVLADVLLGTLGTVAGLLGGMVAAVRSTGRPGRRRLAQE